LNLLNILTEIVVTWGMFAFVVGFFTNQAKGWNLFATPFRAILPLLADALQWMTSFIFLTCIAGGLRALWRWLIPAPPAHPSTPRPHGRPRARRRRHP